MGINFVKLKVPRTFVYDIDKDYLVVRQWQKPDFLAFFTDFFLKAGIKRKGDIPIFLFPSHDYEQFSYAIIELLSNLYGSVTPFQFDAHSDASPLPLPIETGVAKPIKDMEKTGEEPLSFEEYSPRFLKPPKIKPWIRSEVKYEKRLDVGIYCFNFIADVLEDNLAREYYLLQKPPKNRAGLLRFTINEIQGMDNVYSFTCVVRRRGDVLELTKSVVDNSDKAFYHIDPDVLSIKGVTGIDYEGQGNLSLEEMRDSVRYAYDQGKLAGMAAYTWDIRVENTLREALFS